eukprot:1127939_1
MDPSLVLLLLQQQQQQQRQQMMMNANHIYPSITSTATGLPMPMPTLLQQQLPQHPQHQTMLQQQLQHAQAAQQLQMLQQQQAVLSNIINTPAPNQSNQTVAPKASLVPRTLDLYELDISIVYQQDGRFFVQENGTNVEVQNLLFQNVDKKRLIHFSRHGFEDVQDKMNALELSKTGGERHRFRGLLHKVTQHIRAVVERWNEDAAAPEQSAPTNVPTPSGAALPKKRNRKQMEDTTSDVTDDDDEDEEEESEIYESDDYGEPETQRLIKDYIKKNGHITKAKFKKHCKQLNHTECVELYPGIVSQWTEKNSPSTKWWFVDHGNNGYQWVTRDQKKGKTRKVRKSNKSSSKSNTKGPPAKKRRKMNVLQMKKEAARNTLDEEERLLLESIPPPPPRIPHPDNKILSTLPVLSRGTVVTTTATETKDTDMVNVPSDDSTIKGDSNAVPQPIVAMNELTNTDNVQCKSGRNDSNTNTENAKPNVECKDSNHQTNPDKHKDDDADTEMKL